MGLVDTDKSFLRGREMRLTRELIITLGLMSLVSAVTLLFFGIFAFDIQVTSENCGFVVAIYVIMSAILWLFLLFRKC